MLDSPGINLIQPVNRQDPLNLGLRHWWLVMPGNQAGQVWRDITKNGQDGTLVSMNPQLRWIGANSDRQGGFGSIRKGATAERIDIGIVDITGYSASTFQTWVRPVDPPGPDTNGRIFSLRFSGGDDIRFFYTSGTTFIFTMDDGSTSGQIITTMSFNEWHQVVGTHDGSTQSLYIDGELIEANAKTYNYSGTDGRAAIGTLNGGGSGVVGLYDDVRIYDRSLSASEVNALYQESVRV